MHSFEGDSPGKPSCLEDLATLDDLGVTQNCTHAYLLSCTGIHQAVVMCLHYTRSRLDLLYLAASISATCGCNSVHLKPSVLKITTDKLHYNGTVHGCLYVGTVRKIEVESRAKILRSNILTHIHHVGAKRTHV